jgi:hypothetical protein
MDGQTDVIVLGSVKSRRSGRHLAADLFASPLWLGRRCYAERSGLPWFILSARYGLVRPDDVVDSYDVSMDERDATTRRVMGETAVAKLDEAVGGLAGKRVEVHGSRAHVAALQRAIEARGGEVVVPLAGLPTGRQLRWYGEVAAST